MAFIFCKAPRGSQNQLISEFLRTVYEAWETEFSFVFFFFLTASTQTLFKKKISSSQKDNSGVLDIWKFSLKEPSHLTFVQIVWVSFKNHEWKHQKMNMRQEIDVSAFISIYLLVDPMHNLEDSFICNIQRKLWKCILTMLTESAYIFRISLKM